jgi:hypothetical protein
MREIKVWHKAGKFALSIDGVYQNVENEADLLRQLLELEIPQDRAEASIRRIKQTPDQVTP